MRKIVLALAAVAALGVALPTFVASPAEAKTVVIVKKDRDHGRHLGRHFRHFGWYKHRHHARMYVR